MISAIEELSIATKEAAHVTRGMLVNSLSLHERTGAAGPARSGRLGIAEGWRDHLAGLALLLWILCLVAPFITQTSYQARAQFQSDGAAFTYQLAGFLIFLPLIFASRGFAILRSEFIQCGSVKGLCTTALFALLMLHAVLSSAIMKSLIYAVTTWSIFILFSSFWRGSLARLRIWFVVAGCVLILYLALVVSIHGVSDRVHAAGTKIGGVQSNIFGKATLVALVCFFFAEGRLRWLGVAACIGFMFLATSRSSLAAAAIFMLGYYLVKLTPSRTAIAFGIGLGALCAAEIGALVFSGAGVFEHLNRTILFLDDPGRGIGSGITGRSDRWLDGLERLMERPLSGYGFRAARSAHNGYINLALDVGLIIAALMLFLFFGDAAKRATLARFSPVAREEREWREAVRVNIIAAAYIGSSLFLWLLEPTYLNIGFANSLLLILFFSAPYVPPLASRTPM